VGRHPYAGIYQGEGDPNFEQLIAEYRFAYGPDAASWKMAPAPFTPKLTNISSQVAKLFRNSFERSRWRPNPIEWIVSLKALESQIVECVSDASHKYWRGDGSCTWCKLIATGGLNYYPGESEGVLFFDEYESALTNAIDRLGALAWINVAYTERHFSSAVSPDPAPIPEADPEERMMTIVLASAVALGFVLIFLSILHPAIGFVGAVFSLIFGAWLAFHWSKSSRRLERKRRSIVLECASRDLRKAWIDVREIRREYEQLRLKAVEDSLKRLSEWKNLAHVYRKQVLSVLESQCPNDNSVFMTSALFIQMAKYYRTEYNRLKVDMQPILSKIEAAKILDNRNFDAILYESTHQLEQAVADASLFEIERKR